LEEDINLLLILKIKHVLSGIANNVLLGSKCYKYKRTKQMLCPTILCKLRTTGEI
jgi:hypothetical protein